MKFLSNLIAPLSVQIKAVLVLFVIGLLLIAGFGLHHLIDSAQDSAEEKGAAKVERTVATKGLSNVEAANRAVVDASIDDRIARAECLRYSFTPENC